MTQQRDRPNEAAGGPRTPSPKPGVPPVGSGLDRRDFVRVAGLGAAGLVGAASAEGAKPGRADAAPAEAAAVLADPVWPSLRHYPQDRLARIALPLGGIGTGTVSLGGRGDLCDWEIMNRPAKGFVPSGGGARPFFALFARAAGGSPVSRILEGPLESFEFEGSHGAPAPNAGLPRFRQCSFMRRQCCPIGGLIQVIELLGLGLRQRVDASGDIALCDDRGHILDQQFSANRLDGEGSAM